MRRRALALALLGLLASGCRPLRRLRRSATRHATPALPHTTATGLYSARPAEGPALRVRRGHYLLGALRRTDGEAASAPWPATPLVAAAAMDDGWRFASADGTLYAAARFTAALRVVGALPARAPLPSLDDRLRSAHGVFSRGALVVVDDAQRAWMVGADDTPRPLPGAGYLSGAMRDAAVGLFVREPGEALLTVDGGRTLRPLALPEGAAARSVALVDDALRVDTAAGPMRLDDALALVNDPDAAPLGLWLPARTTVDRSPHDHADDGVVLPRDATQAAMMSTRRLAVIRHERLDVVDAQTGLELDHYTLPGTACTLATSGAGLRAVCTHHGWARAVFALQPTGQWEVLRDELRGEALGELAFDDASPAWAVAAPCARTTEIDPTRLCLYDGRGGRTELRLPFDGGPVAFHDGALLVAEAARSEGRTRAALVRSGRVETLDLPMRGDAARTLRLHGEQLSGWVYPDDGPPAFARGRARHGATPAWTMRAAPASMRQGVAGPADLALALGQTAAEIFWQRGAQPFVPLPSPVEGHPAALALADTGSAYCVGPRCRLGEGLEWTFAAVTGPAPFLARQDAPPTLPAPLPDFAPLRCTRQSPLGGGTLGALRWQQAPDTLRVVWESPPRIELQAPIRPRGAGARVVLRRAAEAPVTLALLERCDDIGCDLVVITPARIHQLTLPDGVLARSSDIAPLDEGHAIVRAGISGEGYAATRSWVLDLRAGVVLRGREVVHRAAPEAVAVGMVGERVGLWVAAAPGRVRFVGVLDDHAAPSMPHADTTWPEPHGRTPLCTDAGEALGVMLGTTPSMTLDGDGWSGATLPWHLIARYRLTPSGFCLQGLAGRRDDDSPAAQQPAGLARFNLTAQGPTLVGEGHTATTRHPLRCTL